MKTSNFQKDIRVTNECMKMLAISNKGCGQLTSNDTYFADIWFSSVKTAEKMAAAGVDYCGTVNTIHKGFFYYVRKVDEIFAGGFISCYG